MNKNYNKYSLIIAVVIILCVIVRNVTTNDIVYAYSDPQPLQLEEKVFSSTSEGIEVVIQEEGYISQIYADDEFIYYVERKPIFNVNTRGLSKKLTYIKKVNMRTNEVQILHEVNSMGKVDIWLKVYNQDYCFINMDIVEGNKKKESILKMDTETGDIEVVYEKTRPTGKGYYIANFDIDYDSKRLIWTESYRDVSKNKIKNNYKIYDIEKDEFATHELQENTYIHNPGLTLTLNKNVVVYDGINKKYENIIVCETIDENEISEISQIRKVNIHKGDFRYGEYNDGYLVWGGDIEGDSFGDFENNAYILDFNTGEQFVIGEFIFNVRLYNDYIVVKDDEFIDVIDYRNKQKQKYLIKERQELINVTNNYVVLKEYTDNKDEFMVVYKAISK